MTPDVVIRLGAIAAGLVMLALAAWTIVRTQQTGDESAGCFGIMLGFGALVLIVGAAQDIHG